jgi:hypothetical protein
MQKVSRQTAPGIGNLTLANLTPAAYKANQLEKMRLPGNG